MLRRMEGFRMQVRRMVESKVITSRASGEEKRRTKSRRVEESELIGEVGEEWRRGGNSAAGGGVGRGGRRTEVSRRWRCGQSLEDAKWSPWQLWHFGVEKAAQGTLCCHESRHRCGSELVVCKNLHDGRIPGSGNIEAGNHAFWDLPNEHGSGEGPLGLEEQWMKSCGGRHTRWAAEP